MYEHLTHTVKQKNYKKIREQVCFYENLFKHRDFKVNVLLEALIYFSNTSFIVSQWCHISSNDTNPNFAF